MTRPLVIAFAVVTAGGLVWPLVRTGRSPGGLKASGYHPIAADLPITIGFLVVGVAVLFEAREWPFRTAVFPLATGAILVGLSLMKLAARAITARGTIRDAKAGEADREGPPRMTEMDVPDIFATATRREWLSAIGWMSIFFLMFWLLGALIAVPLFAVVYLLTVSRSSPVVAGVYALASWVFVYGLFGRLLRVPLP